MNLGSTSLAAVKAYAIESADFARSKVFFSGNGFKSERRNSHVQDIASGCEEAKAKDAEIRASRTGRKMRLGGSRSRRNGVFG